MARPSPEALIQVLTMLWDSMNEAGGPTPHALGILIDMVNAAYDQAELDAGL